MGRLFKRLKHLITHPINTVKEGSKLLVYATLSAIYLLYYGKNIILLESHYEFGGNSGALYNYMNKQDRYKKYTYVWIIKGYKKGTVKNTRRVLVFSRHDQSYLKMFFLKHAKFAFYDDAPIRAEGKNAKTIYLGHGTLGLKNVQGIVKVPPYVDCCLCTSDDMLDESCKKRGLPKEKFFICGMPRNDILFEKSVSKLCFFDEEQYERVILWMPTFRKAKDSDRDDGGNETPLGIPLVRDFEDLDYLDQWLRNNNMLVVVKMHPAQDLSVVTAHSTKNIFFLSHKDLVSNRLDTNALFPHSDALLTDYSSVASDYLLINKPIGYIVKDFDKYRIPLTWETYNSRTPGNKIYTLDDLIAFFSDVKSGIDAFGEERRKLAMKTHKYHDNCNCQRILDRFAV